MSMRKKMRWPRRVAVLAVCLCLGISWAQAKESKQKEGDAAGQDKTAQAPAQSQPSPTPSKPDEGYVIGPSDVLAINVWKEPEISRAIPVRSDGRISLPLVGEVQAAGKTPYQLQQDISKKLQTLISEPDVTVIVQEIRSQKFNILGQVARPGSYLLTDSTTVLDAIAVAGGFRDFAKQRAIYVLRQNPDGTQSRYPFNYKEVVKGKNIEQNIKL